MLWRLDEAVGIALNADGSQEAIRRKVRDAQDKAVAPGGPRSLRETFDPVPRPLAHQVWIEPMNCISFSACAVSAAFLALSSPARADFASCVSGLRADAARAGISERDDRPRVQRPPARHEGAGVPEAAARVQDADLGLCRGPRRRRAGRGRQGGDGRERRRARPRRADLRGQPLHDRRDLGGRIRISARRWASGRWCSRSRRSPAWASGRGISAPS